MPGYPQGDEGGKRLMSFKEFILNQSDNIDEQEALKSYIDYKTEYTRRQIEKFFKEHEDEEWFRYKYKPTELKKLEEATKESKAKRKELYSKLIESGETDNVTLDQPHEHSVLQFLDNFSLLLEGATLEEIKEGEARKLYSVSALYIPALHPAVDKSKIEEYAKTHPDFLRVGVSDAIFNSQPPFCRRVWISYKKMDSDAIRKLTWAFNAQKFVGHETKSIVNKESNNRIRYTQFWFCHATVAKHDLKNVANLLSHFEGEDCPLLEEIKNHLIEETNEEETVWGLNEQDDKEFEFTQDPELMKALDKVILYLRVVHSYDYYSSTEHLREDDLPQKIGVMLIRPTPPSSYGDCPKELLREFIEAQKARVDSFLTKPTISEIEQKQLGKKDVEEEVENFIFQNIHEKTKGEKYVCLITKKKFQAMEFARKHIINRCGSHLDEVRTNAEFFNNYLADPKRPM